MNHTIVDDGSIVITPLTKGAFVVTVYMNGHRKFVVVESLDELISYIKIREKNK